MIQNKWRYIDEEAKMCVMDGGTLRGNYNYIAYDNSCIGCEILNITVQMYPCSEGTDTGSPAL